MTDTDFRAFLARIQLLIGLQLAAAIFYEHRFFAVQFTAELERVDTPLQAGEVTLCFSNGATIDLAPGEQIILSEDDGRIELLLSPELAVELAPA